MRSENENFVLADRNPRVCSDMGAANRRLSDREIKDIVSSKNGALERLIDKLRETRKFPKGTNFEVLVSQVRAACKSYSPDSGLSRTERHEHLNKLCEAIKSAYNSALNYKDREAHELGVLYGEVGRSVRFPFLA